MMKLRIDWDERDVIFLNDSANAHIINLKEDIDNMINDGVKDDQNDAMLELYKINITAWDRIFEETKRALKRRGSYDLCMCGAATESRAPAPVT